jgi:16S rRNA processing protein RimM
MSAESRQPTQSERGLEAHVSEPRFLALGKVLRPHGVRGELFLQLTTDYPDRVAALGVVYLAADIDGADAVACPVDGARRHRGGLILRLKTVTDRDEADAYRNRWVLVPIEDAVPLEDGEFYLFQIVGLTVVTAEGETLGTVRDVIETGANDVYVVQGGPRGELLIPAAPHVVLDIDLAAKCITVDLPDGLL